MRERLLFFLLLSVILNSQAQNAFTDAARDRSLSILAVIGQTEDMVETVMIVSDLVYETTYVIEKTERCKKELDGITNLMGNGVVHDHYMGQQQSKDYVRQIQMYNANVRIYGRAARSMLQSIEAALKNYQKVSGARTALDLGAKDVVNATKEFLFSNLLKVLRANPTTALAGVGRGVDMTSVKERITEDLERDEIYSRMELWKETLRGYVSSVNKLSLRLDRITSDIIMMKRVIHSGIGFGIVAGMYMVGNMADRIAASQGKQYDVIKEWENNNVLEEKKRQEQLKQVNQEIKKSANENKSSVNKSTNKE